MSGRGELGFAGSRDSREATYTSYSVFCALVAALSAFTNGYNIGVPNAPELVIRACEGIKDPSAGGAFPACLPMSTTVWGFVVAAFCLGGMVGGLGSGWLMSRFGRRPILIFNNLVFIAGGVLVALSNSSGMMIAGRVIIGLACGVSMVVAPVYIGEVATLKCRGAYGTLPQLFVVLSILIAQLLGLGLSNAPGWRILFGITVIPAILQMILLPMFCVETPPYLASCGRIDEANASLARLRKGYDVRSEMEEILSVQGSRTSSGDEDIVATGAKEGTENMGILQLLRSHMLGTTITAIVVHASQQLTGINSVFYYSTSMFAEALGSDVARAVTVGIGALNFVMTFVSSALVDRTGRKVLLLSSLAGLILMSVVIVVASVFGQNIVVVASVFLFVASFAMGLGPVPWMLMPELFPIQAVGAASSLANCVNWLSNFIIGQVFPIINEHLGDYAFIVFAAVGTVFFIYLWFRLVETKGKTVEDIQRELYGPQAGGKQEMSAY
ncbi:general substrate transporter [Thamnocephalis sphaerospora]|uniref:General substrate transporter n=1 Tax=Thamnocephalis sphaerospora TaxID=78915 RepID=A0A4P9XMW3_9FUNG|nr:general substrate transporter [Thamnocephalis sphaerospora]|eukprot:RKP07264.1 general substrate transporter [Thamnocephalis sphaerospora]